MNEEKLGEFSVKVKTVENNYTNSIKVKRTSDCELITWKEILIGTLDCFKGMGYIIDSETENAIRDAIDYYD